MLLNFHEYGQGRAVVILHGLFGSARNWQGIAGKLAEDYHVITPDLRNHGQSPHTQTMSYYEMADDVVSLINKLKLNDVIIIGHSMGGKVAMTAVLNNRQRFAALVAVDIAPVSYGNNFKTVIDAMSTLPLQSIKNRADAKTYLCKTIGEPRVVEFILQNLVRTEDGFAWRINLQTINAGMAAINRFPDSLSGISNQLPCLFLGGAGSGYLASVHKSAMVEYFPAARIKMLEGAGHWVHAEKPDEFLKQIKMFINDV